MRRLLIVAIALWMGIDPTLAQSEKPVDLKTVPPNQQVESVGYCQGRYSVRLKDGSVRQFTEYDLSFKIDSGPNGPKSGAPTLIKAGMAGDRGLLIFSGLEEMKRLPQKTC